MGASNLLVAALLLGGIWAALPMRWWPVDVVGTGLGLALGVSGVGLVRGTSWASKLAKGTALASLAIGLVLTTTLAMTIGQLSGLYGPVGVGGALILAVVFALVLPYLVVLPAAQVYLLTPRDEP